MQLFYRPDITGDTIALDPDESRHAVRVLRLGAGGTVHVTDGRGGLYTASLADPDPKGCVLRVTSVERGFGRRPYGVTLCIAPPKNPERFEWLLEKATEVGVDRIVPLLCARSERRVLKTERERKVIVAAMKQSLKAYLPQLDELTPFCEAVAAPFEGVKLIAHCDPAGRRVAMREAVGCGENVMILIGPEGDFSPEEVNFATANGFRGVTLGDVRLRTETAGLVALVDVMFINS